MEKKLYAEARANRVAKVTHMTSTPTHILQQKQLSFAQNLNVSDFCFLDLPLSFACTALRFCCAAF